MERPRPSDWSKTIDQLCAENRPMSGEEIRWAREYERDQLRPWARFPRAREIHELTADAEISFVTHWMAAFTGGGKGLLRKGTRVRIDDYVDGDEPIGVYAHPLEARRVELELIPESERLAEKYGGYSLSIRTAELNRLFRLVAESDSAG